MQVLVQVNETANSSLIRSESIWRQPTGFKWIAAATLVLIHAIVSPEVNYGGKVDLLRGTSFDWVTYQLVLSRLSRVTGGYRRTAGEGAWEIATISTGSSRRETFPLETFGGGNDQFHGRLMPLWIGSHLSSAVKPSRGPVWCQQLR